MHNMLRFWAVFCMVLIFLGSPLWQVQAAGERIAVLLGPTQDKFIGTLQRTIEAEARLRGMQVSTFSSPFDAALQARQLDDAVAQKFDVVVLQTLSQNAIIPSLRRAKQAGIPVLTIAVELPAQFDDLHRAYIGENARKLGELAGEAMAGALKAAGKSKGRIAAITGTMSEGIAVMRMEGFKAAMARLAPEVGIVAVEDVKWNPVVGEQVAGQLLARFSADGGLDGMYGMNDRLANAAAQAASTAGVKVGTNPGDLIVVGGNCQAPGIQILKAGRMAATIKMLPVVTGARAVEVIEKLLAGQAVPRTHYEDHLIVTPANLAEHADACSY